MKFEVKEIDSITRELKVNVTPEELTGIEQKILKNFQKFAEIPGFRKGRVPLGMVKNRYSEEIQKEIVEEAISRFYQEAMEKSGIPAISAGKVSNLQFEDIKSGLSFDVEVEVEPEIELKKYKHLEIDKEVMNVTDEMVAEVKQNLLENYATVKEEDEVREGYYITFDAQLLGEGNVPVIGRKFEDVTVQVGSGEFDKEVESQLVGLKTGEKKIVEKQSPASERSSDPVKERMEITVKRIEMREFPQLNDEFVKSLGDEKLETVEQLEEKIRKNLEQDLQYRIDQMLRGRVIDALLKENPFDVPNSMVEHYLEHIIADIKQKSKGERIDEDYLRQTYRPQAIHNIRWFMLKRKIAEAESIDVALSEVHEAIDKFTLDDSQKEQFKNNQNTVDNIRDELLEQKVLDFLLKEAKITEIEPKEPAAF